jgi:flagellar protein FlgJ
MTAPVPSSAAYALTRYSAAQPAQAQAASQTDPRTAKAKAAAEEFEAVFLSTMFNHMFASLKGDGPLGGSRGTDVWRSFLADEYARTFARSGGVGIGDQIYRTLLQYQEVGQ